MAVKPIPDGYHTVTPLLMVSNASKFIDFVIAAFGATEKSRHEMEGKVMHAEVKIGDSLIMLGEANDRYPALPGALYLYVNDVDSTYKQAIGAGATSLREPTTEFYGDRSSGVKDSFGNQWWIATHVEDVTEAQLAERMAEAAKQHGAGSH